VVVCKPADPEAKGLIERCHDYLERSFLPGRDFASPADFNAQLAQWLAVVNTRTRRALGCAPADRIAADTAAMLALPPVAPATGWRSAARLARDHYVRLDSSDYSVHPAVIGRRIEVVAGLDRVRVLCGGRLVADHEPDQQHPPTEAEDQAEAPNLFGWHLSRDVLDFLHRTGAALDIDEYDMSPDYADD
jgi:hypothetical protein